MAKSKLSSSGARGASPLLKEGSTGPAVVRLQTKLKKVGFNPGRADGDFGPATTAALIGFQKSAGLLADGIAGPRTLAALKLAATDRLPSVIPGVTVTIVSKMKGDPSSILPPAATPSIYTIFAPTLGTRAMATAQSIAAAVISN